MDGWTVLAVLAVVVIVAMTWLIVRLLRDELATYRRQRQLTDDALRYQRHRELHQRLYGQVETARRQQLETAAKTERPQ